ncbi:MAG: PQQ-binding-like beta-propeller repeat protein [Armatimonadetes bacterium]|nr:PQQ-binding-like beta-propeller repeat protein [Armatimonadota bacterium]
MRVRNRPCPIRVLPLLAAVAALLPAPSARAAAYTYSTRQRTINAGILIVDDRGATSPYPISSGMGEGNPSPTPAQIAQGASNPDPYVFYVFNNRYDIKPLGWNLVNPLAPTTVTGDILARWDARTANGPNTPNGGTTFLGYNGGHAYQLNQRITPNMAPYWEVPFSKHRGLDDLLQFDILLINIPPGKTLALRNDEAQQLRRFVDNGGQLWIEGNGGTIANDQNISPYGPMFFDMQFNYAAGTGQGILPPSTVFGTVLRHPIVDTPYLLSDDEINGLGETHIKNTIVASTGPPNAADPTFLSTVVGNANAGNAAVIAAGQFGAGQVIITTTGTAAAINDSVGGIDAGFGFNTNYPSNSGPYCGTNFYAAPTADLKLLANILSWDTAHPTEHKNSHQSSQSRSNFAPALTPTWSYPTASSTAATPGAAINGNYVYVRSADGVLRAFNAQPGTDIIGNPNGSPDAGTPDFVNGYSYDEIWDTTGKGFPNGPTPLTVPPDPYASAPTVTTTAGGQALVLWEDSSGTVHVADAITGQAYGSGSLPGSGGGGPYSAGTGPAPAPTVYGGRVYAGQPGGTLYVFDFNPNGSAKGGVQYQFSAGGEPVIAPPSVGIVRETVNGVQSDSIVAAVTTTLGVYTVMLGARHDFVDRNTTRPQHAVYGANTLVSLGPGPNNFDIDPLALPLLYRVYSDNNGYPGPVAATVNAGTNTFTYTAMAGVIYYADYDVDFANAASGTNKVLNRAVFNVNPTGGTASATFVSAPALSQSGYYFYTANLSTSLGTDSTLVCIRDARQSSDPPNTNRMFWRFRLPYATDSVIDADGNSYNDLQGFQFLGAPVVDVRGNVFALAVRPGTNQAAILCFKGTQQVSAQVVSPGTTANVSSMTQALGSGQDEFGNASPQSITSPAQYSATPDNNGNINFYNFGTVSNSLGFPAVSPNLAEPQPVSASYSINNAPSTTQALMHTNMTWYALLPTTGQINTGSGLALAGKYLFFGDSSGRLYRFYAYPGEASLIGTNRKVAPGTPANPTLDSDGRPIFNFNPAPINAGQINGVPSAGNNVMVVNGTSGVVCLSNRYSLVADSDRVLEVDAEGVASWAVDATSRPAPNGAVTHLELNRPASIFQLAPNDYLVADTGNNRCVRFDRSGNVLWELTRFNDFADPNDPAPNTFTLFGKGVPRLTPGEPTTLNHPTSVQSYRTYVRNPNNPNTIIGTVIHYLISDTGNYRILEVVDAYDAQGRPVGPPHNLVWLSHTFDRQGRRYRYAGASYFTAPGGKQYVAALVTNARLAQPPPATDPATGSLGPAVADAPGSSIVLLDYDPLNALGVPFTPGAPETGFGANGQADGFISHAISTYNVYLINGQFDINGAPKQTPPATPGGIPGMTSATGQLTQVYLRNPRFLQTYTPPGGTGALQNFLLADDNGVFDLFLDTGGQFATPKNQFVAQWGFTQADYQNLPTPIDATLALPLLRNGLEFSPTPPGPRLTGPISFVPSSLQRVGTDLVADNAGSFLIGHYILANAYSQALVTPATGFGGEALELNTIVNSNGLLQPNAFASFSKPIGTGPLSQPAFAIREK